MNGKNNNEVSRRLYRMNGRNRITVALFVMILFGGSLAAMLTIQRYDEIRDQFSNFIDILKPEDIDRSEEVGVFNLFYSSIIESSSAVMLKSNNYYPPNNSLTINNIWFTMTEIELIGRDMQNGSIFSSYLVVDLVAGIDSELLFIATNVTTGTYALMKVYYENTVIVNTEEEGNVTLSTTERDFFVLPIFEKKNKEKQTDIEVKSSEETNVVIAFHSQIIWQTNMFVSKFFCFVKTD